MNYKERAKNRRLKKDLINFLSLFKFKTGNIKLSGKIILFGILVSNIGLFSPWIIYSENNGFENSFSASVGNIGTTNMLSLIILTFLSLSINNKERIKKYSGIQIKDYIMIIFLGLIIAILSLHGIIFIKSLLSFSKDIILGKGAILTLTGSILILVGGIIMRKDFNRDYISYINETEEKNKNNLKSNRNSNMKLPF